MSQIGLIGIIIGLINTITGLFQKIYVLINNSFMYTNEGCGKTLNVSTCIQDGHTPYFIYPVNNLAVSSF